MTKLTRRLTVLLSLAGLVLPSSFMMAVNPGFEVGDTYCLEGATNFYIYSVGEHRALFDGFSPCTAVLTITGEDSFMMVTREILPDGIRESVKTGKITPSGRVSFDYPGEAAAMQMFVGVTAHGRGVIDGNTIYKGWFDGETFYASFEVIGHQTQPALFPFYNKDPDDPEVLFKGPISIYEDFDLVVVECPAD